MNNQRTIIIALAALNVLAIAGFAIYNAAVTGKHDATITTVVTPTNGTTIKVNGFRVAEGDLSVAAGGYKIEISHDGFDSQTKTVIVKNGETKKVAVALKPNSQQTANYYADPSTPDAQKAEGIAGSDSAAVGTSQVNSLPVLKRLPRSVDGQYRIDYGYSQKKPDDPSAVSLIITPLSSDGKQKALNWLKYQGYDESNTEITYQSVGGE